MAQKEAIERVSSETVPSEQKLDPHPEQASNSGQTNDKGRQVGFIHTKET